MTAKNLLEEKEVKYQKGEKIQFLKSFHFQPNLLPPPLLLSDEDMDYLTSFNVSLCSITTTEVFNHTETDMMETELCSLGQFKVD